MVTLINSTFTPVIPGSTALRLHLLSPHSLPSSPALPLYGYTYHLHIHSRHPRLYRSTVTLIISTFTPVIPGSTALRLHLLSPHSLPSSPALPLYGYTYYLHIHSRHPRLYRSTVTLIISTFTPVIPGSTALRLHFDPTYLLNLLSSLEEGISRVITPSADHLSG